MVEHMGCHTLGPGDGTPVFLAVKRCVKVIQEKYNELRASESE